MSDPYTCQSHMYEDIGGLRTQNCPDNESTDLTEYPGIMKWFEHNLKVSNTYITWNTKIRSN